jgi:hypothetical protein
VTEVRVGYYHRAAGAWAAWRCRIFRGPRNLARRRALDWMRANMAGLVYLSMTERRAR